MSLNDPTPADTLAVEYASALREYLSGSGEAALTRAYEIGRRAAGSGRGIVDLAMLHHDALLHLAPSSIGDVGAVATATQFLAETLSPFEMALRSYQENARLLGLSETLARQNAETLRARDQLRTILDATTAVIYLKDAAGRYLFVNRQFQEVFRIPGEQAIGKLDADVLPATAARKLQSEDERVLETRAPRQLEQVLPTRDGARTYLSLKFPLVDAGGVPYGLCCVATDITERKRAEEALQRARDAAERERQLKLAVQARDEFLTIASHELKTPLTSLELQIASLKRFSSGNPLAPVSDEKVLSKCENMLKQIERLTVLINTLLDIGRITSGTVVLSREAVDLGEVVRAVIERSRDAIRRSGSAVALDASAPVVGSWDRPHLETVVANLVSNAVKFGEGRPIEIAVASSAGRAILTVCDHGIGISVEDQERIFGRFERAVSERHFGGFGVGLWIARHAVEAHGGAIRVESRRGEGSKFTVELPLDGTGS